MRIPLLAVPFVALLTVPSLGLVFAGDEALPLEGGEQWTANLIGISSSYGQETWKYDSRYYTNPASAAAVASHVQNVSTSYFGAVGLRARLTIEICQVDEEGRCDRAAQANLEDYNVTASIETSRGSLYALVLRENRSQVFNLDFDMDGSNTGDPTGRTAVPAADAGLQTVKVTILQTIRPDPPRPVGDATLYFTYVIPRSNVRSTSTAGTIVQSTPDSMFRLFNDIGWDLSVLTILRPVNVSTMLYLDYDFPGRAANPGETVELWAFIAERAVQPPVGGTQPAPVPDLPFIPGISDNDTLRKVVTQSDVVHVNAEQIGDPKTGPSDRVSFNVTGADLLSPRSDVNLERALVVVAPVLKPSFNATACRGVDPDVPCKGLSQFRVGATELVVPISDRRVGVDRFELSGSGLSGTGAPSGPLRDFALSVNALNVHVRDVDGFSQEQTRTGDLFALVPDTRNAKPLTGGSLSPKRNEPNKLSGSMPVRPLHDQGVTQYRIFALLYAERDTFYGMASADRGYLLSLSAPTTTIPPGEGKLNLTLLSRTTDYVHPARDAAFRITVFYQVEAPDAEVNITRSVEIPEGGTFSVDIPFKSQQPAEIGVRVTTTSGDVLPPAQTVKMGFVAEEPEKGLADRIPGFDAVLLLAALGGVLAAWNRRRHA